MKSKVQPTHAKKYQAILVGLTLALCACLLSSCSLYLDYREYEMRKQFSEKFDILVQIEKMQRVDKYVTRLALDWINEIPPNLTDNSDHRSSVSISQKRWNQYKALFYAAGVEIGFMIINRPKESRVLAIDVDSAFGFTYREKPPSKVFKSFNECRAIKYDDQYRCYTFLSENWYMHLGPINEPPPFKY